ncbi:MAG TPA: ABC transporter substrate-binding protein [Solirubrobacterales bacterium]|jgi:branched-chain amino acid transport system substrate-binding protein
MPPETNHRGQGTRNRPKHRLLLPLLLASALALGLTLTACGSSDSTSSSSASGSTDSGGESAGVAQIPKYLGPIKSADSGKGKKLDVGVTVALSGEGSVWGTVQLKGAELAAEQIKELGGPEFHIIASDNKSGDPSAGVEAARKLAANHVGMGLTSYTADVGAMLPEIKKAQILSFDGGGGTSVFAEGSPYFWGSRAVTPGDALPGVLKYVQETEPEAKRVAMIFWDLGGELNKVVEENAKQQIEEAGMELVLYEPTQIGSTDFTTTIQHISDSDPDVVLAGVYGIEVANFMKQYVSSGTETPLFGFDITAQAREAAGSALNGFKYAFDYFDSDAPSNGWAQIFVDSYEEAYGSPPDFYAANFYEDMYVLWDLVRRVEAKGGDPASGEQLQKALEEEPQFPSVYGGNGEEAGTLAFDLATHSVAKRPMGLFEYSTESEESKLLASFNINGSDFVLK